MLTFADTIQWRVYRFLSRETRLITFAPIFVLEGVNQFRFSSPWKYYRYSRKPCLRHEQNAQEARMVWREMPGTWVGRRYIKRPITINSEDAAYSGSTRAGINPRGLSARGHDNGMDRLLSVPEAHRRLKFNRRWRTRKYQRLRNSGGHTAVALLLSSLPDISIAMGNSMLAISVKYILYNASQGLYHSIIRFVLSLMHKNLPVT